MDHSPHFGDTFYGHLDENCQRYGNGFETWRENIPQGYFGSFFKDLLHGDGRYIYVSDSGSHTYEGNLYANNFEGYATVKKSDGTRFDGLFKNNRIFGPGVLSYVDGMQDVGLWQDGVLKKLSCVVLDGQVPGLATDVTFKTVLLKYRDLVPVRGEKIDVAKNIVETISADPDVVCLYTKLYNSYVRDRDSLFFNKGLYDEHFLNAYNDEELTCDSTQNQDLMGAFSNFNIELLLTLFNKRKTFEEYTGEDQELCSRTISKNTTVCKPMKSNSNELKSTLSLSHEEPINFNYITKSDNKIIELHTFPSDEENVAISSSNRNRNQFSSQPRTFSNDANKLSVSPLQCQISQPDAFDVEVPSEISTEEMPISHLLAWNNEEEMVELMKHTFLYRNKEHKVNFNVTDILMGERRNFNTPGDHEQECVAFLTHCGTGDVKVTSEILQRFALNPDVCDVRGNSGIMFAASEDHCDVIKILCNNGANLDISNDEGLTPLNVCLLRYISCQRGVNDWGKAFLKPTQFEEVTRDEWRTCTPLNVRQTFTDCVTQINTNVELVNMLRKVLRESQDCDLNKKMLEYVCDEFLNMELRKISGMLKNVPQDADNSYVFNTSCIIPQKKNSKKNKRTKKTVQKAAVQNTVSRKKKTKESQNKNDSKPTDKFDYTKEKLNAIERTVSLLLRSGCDPDISTVPMPSLIISLFTKNTNMLRLLLDSGANPNVATSDENLTTLHVLCCLPFNSTHLEMFHLLLKYKSDPNLKTSSSHWIEEKRKLLAGNPMDGDDSGKTALHILCMRYDFVQNDAEIYEMVQLLLDFGANPSARYLEHSPLSLSVLRGNLKLVKYLLETNKFDPYWKLGGEMGTVLTVLMLRRYKNILNVNTCRQILDLLVSYNVNPLNCVDDIRNAIEFIDEEYKSIGSRGASKSSSKLSKKSKSSKVKNVAKRHKSVKSHGTPKSSKSKETKTKSSNVLKSHLVNRAKEFLSRHIQGTALRYLIQFAACDEELGDDVAETLARFLDMDDCRRIIQIFLNENQLKCCEETKIICLDVLNFVSSINKSTQCKLRGGKLSERKIPSPEEVLNSIDWKKCYTKRKSGLPLPEVDKDIQKYEVCFHCCRKIRKDLIACPNCELVYFCSQDCNQLSNKEQTIHKCKLSFYNNEKLRQKDKHDVRTSKLLNKLKQTDNFLRTSGFLQKYFRPYHGDVTTAPKQSFTFKHDRSRKRSRDDKSVESRSETSSRGRHKHKSKSDVLQSVDVKDLSRFLKKSTRNDEERNESKLKKSYKKLKSDGKTLEEVDTETSQVSKKKKDKMTLNLKGVDGKEKFHKGLKSLASEQKQVHEVKLKDKKGKTKVVTETDKHHVELIAKLSYREERKHANMYGDKKLRERFDRESKFRKTNVKFETKQSAVKKTSKADGKSGKSYKTGLSLKRKGERDDETKEAHTNLQKSAYFSKFPGVATREDFIVPRNYSQTNLQLRGASTIRRLPNKFQHFMEIISKLFPGLDLTLLLLPYVCYGDGQLYYRFLTEKPIFMSTYSDV